MDGPLNNRTVIRNLNLFHGIVGSARFSKCNDAGKREKRSVDVIFHPADDTARRIRSAVVKPEFV